MENIVQGKKEKIVILIKRLRWVFVVLVIGVAAYMVFLQQVTWSNIHMIQSYSGNSTLNNDYAAFGDGLLRYDKDGIAFVSYSGEEKWNHGYQISSPIIDINGKAAAVANDGGNEIVVLDASGVKGEMKTSLPIEKISVSSQGVVAVLTKDVEAPKIIIYDAVGNILAEHKTSFSGTGYPLDVGLSQDGTMLVVTYLNIDEVAITGRIAYYSFNGKTNTITEKAVLEKEINNEILPEAYFIDAQTSIVIGETSFYIFKGTEKPELVNEIKLGKNISGIFHDDSHIGFILKEKNGSNNELRVYNLEGTVVCQVDGVGELANTSIIDNQIIMFEGMRSQIYTMSGRLLFDEEMGMELSGVFPILGYNRYMILGDEGIQKIGLAR